MRIPRCGALAFLALLGATAGPPALAAPLRPPGAVREVPSARVASALSGLSARRTALGLSSLDTFEVGRRFTDEGGQTHVRVRQLHRGVPVWGGEAVAHLDAQGRELAPSGHLVPGLDVDVRPTVAPELAGRVALRQAGVAGPSASTSSTPTLVLYPGASAPGPTVVWDAAQQRWRFAGGSAPAGLARTSGPYRLAYHVHVSGEDAQGRPLRQEVMVDARTGAVLHAWSSLTTDGPVVATGNSRYSGTVSLSVTQSGADFFLRDSTRPVDESGYVLWHPVTGEPGNVVYDLQRSYTWPSGQHLVYRDWDGDDVWGNGQLLQFFDNEPTSGTTGQTAAVDAAYGLQSAWDFYLNVLGRHGVDDGYTPVAVRVHANIENAYWDDAQSTITLGMLEEPQDSSLLPFGTLDVVGHELTHGVTSSTAGLVYVGEAGGLNEATSDILGTMVEFYAYGAGGTGSEVPATGGNWTIAEQLATSSHPTPLRWLDTPSRDGLSFDAWFHGIALYDPHFTSGPLNRMAYFLSQGAAPSGSGSSPFVPGGFPGVGNDRTARIWYRALTTYLTPTSDYYQARTAALRAAKDLYPDDGDVFAAVENAFAAVNVGPAHGKLPRPLVTLHSPTQDIGGGGIALVSAGDTLRPFEAQVTQSLDTGVHWSLQDGGRVDAEGRFTAPIRSGGWLYRIRATSASDPLESAQGFIATVNMDLDDDTVLDAADMGVLALALSTRGGGAFGPSDLFVDGAVNDADVATYVALFNQLFGR